MPSLFSPPCLISHHVLPSLLRQSFCICSFPFAVMPRSLQPSRSSPLVYFENPWGIQSACSCPSLALIFCWKCNLLERLRQRCGKHPSITSWNKIELFCFKIKLNFLGPQPPFSGFTVHSSFTCNPLCKQFHDCSHHKAWCLYCDKHLFLSAHGRECTQPVSSPTAPSSEMFQKK